MYSRILERKEGIQSSYDLPHRLYTATVYPRRSRNGSNIIIYGHERGLRIVWYGGRAFKRDSQHTSANCASIDLTDSPPADKQEFEDEQNDTEDEVSLDPTSTILTYFDISTGTPCSHIAILPILINKTLDDYPQFLDSQIVIAATGIDQSLRIITTPLDPTQKSPHAQIVTIKGLHRDLVQDIAITLTAELADEEEAEETSSSGTRLHGADNSEHSTRDTQSWSLLVASASHTGQGLLVIHQLPIDATGNVSQDPEEHIVVQRCQLRSPFLRTQINFSSAVYPADGHSYLTCTNSKGVKIFQTLPQVRSARQRRASNGTADSTLSATRPSRHVSSTSTRPLITLLPPFASAGPQDLAPRRKQVLDATWVLGGRVIIVLLEDGEWGVWDLQAAGPSSQNNPNHLVKGQKNVAGIHGGSLTRFAVGGNVGSGPQVTKKSSSKSTSNGDQALAPMTPHTRKNRSGELFKKSDPLDSYSSNASCSTKGSVGILSGRDSSIGEERMSDETVVFGYGATNMVLYSLQSYWRSGLGGRSNFDSVATNRPVALPVLLAAGEEQIMAQFLPSGTTSTGIDPSTVTKNRKFIVFSANRMVVFSPRVVVSKSPPAVMSRLPARLAAARSEDVDQVMLESGELSLDGVDRMLDSMAHGPNSFSAVTNSDREKQVGFRFDDDDDEDVDMEGSPTISKSTRSKLTVGNQRGRQLFT